jgi:hypothetical protein
LFFILDALIDDLNGDDDDRHWNEPAYVMALSSADRICQCEFGIKLIGIEWGDCFAVETYFATAKAALHKLEESIFKADDKLYCSMIGNKIIAQLKMHQALVQREDELRKAKYGVFGSGIGQKTNTATAAASSSASHPPKE